MRCKQARTSPRGEQVFDSRAFALGGAHSVRFVPVPTAERAQRPPRPGRGAGRGYPAMNGQPCCAHLSLQPLCRCRVSAVLWTRATAAGLQLTLVTNISVALVSWGSMLWGMESDCAR